MSFARHPRFAFVVVLPIMLLGCSGSPGDDPGGVTNEGPIAQTSQALDAADPCATGDAPNLVIDISKAGTWGEYTRPDVYINSICPRAGRDRPETIVEFNVGAPFKYSFYEFWGVPAWESGVNQPTCEGRSMTGELWYFVSGHTWKLVKRVVARGSWNPDANPGYHCSIANFYHDFSMLESSRYRLHVTATNVNGQGVTVTLHGQNDNIKGM